MTEPTDDPRAGVGFFRGLMAVVRGLAHGVGLVISAFGKVLAVVTRRSTRRDHHDRPA
jgi:hypothetical protein